MSVLRITNSLSYIASQLDFKILFYEDKSYYYNY